MAGKDNVIANMLSKARYKGEDNMLMGNEDDLNFFRSTLVITERDVVGTFSKFKESEYEGERLHLGRFLRSMMANSSCPRRGHKGCE